jgi:anthranilate synthase/aminodeoxychorismate synthase-like glutamine amidotransferase
MKKILLIDNYDSFTYNLFDYFSQLNINCIVKKNDSIKNLSSLVHYDAIVFSPGPKRPQDAPIMFEILSKFAKSKPILGICLGMQAIGEFYGAKLIHAIVPMHGKTSEVIHNNELFFHGFPNPVTVMRYHSLILENVENTGLEIIGKTDIGEIMAIKHKELSITGVQFHPESILTLDGLKMLKNWSESF